MMNESSSSHRDLQNKISRVFFALLPKFSSKNDGKQALAENTDKASMLFSNSSIEFNSLNNKTINTNGTARCKRTHF